MADDEKREWDLEKLSRIRVKADELLDMVNLYPPCDRREDHGKAGCMEAERARHPRGRRPTQDMDPGRMCTPCAATWHATMVLVLVGEMRRFAV